MTSDQRLWWWRKTRSLCQGSKLYWMDKFKKLIYFFNFHFKNINKNWKKELNSLFNDCDVTVTYSHRWLIIHDVDWTFEFWVKTFEITSASMLITKIDNMCWCCDGQLRYFSLFHSNIKIGLVLDEKHQVLVFCSWSYFEISTWDSQAEKLNGEYCNFVPGRN